MAVAAAASGIMHYAGVDGRIVFPIVTIALAGLAWLVAVGTEALGSHLGPGATGVLQSTLGNLPELFVVIFALKAGEVVVAQTSILGSLFANALLVLGAVIIVGARASEDGVMRFKPRLPNDTATLLLLACFIIVLLGLSVTAEDRASHHKVEISAAGAVVLLAVYATWLWSYLHADVRDDAGEHEAGEAPPLSLPAALVLISLLFTTHLTFVLAPVYIGALLITAIAVWQVSGDGEATIPEGAALVGEWCPNAAAAA